MYTLIIEDKNGVIADEFSFHEGSFSIGRVEGNDIILPSSNVSRQHSRLFVRQGSCFIEDLGSSNGVIVDGQRIQGERDLGSAAQIRIGDYYLYLEFNKDNSGGQQDVVSTHIVSQDENAYKLVRVGDAFAGEVFVLSERRNTIGRTEDNSVFLNDPSVSRRHAQIDVDGVIYCVSDMGSSNGSAVNGKRITGPTILREGDRVSFGNLEFVFIPNNETINPSDYAASAAVAPAPGAMPVTGGDSGGLSMGVIIGGVALLFFMLIVLVVLGFAGYFLLKSSEPPPEPPAPVVEEVDTATLIDRHIQDGRARMQSGRWTEAIESFDEALKLDANNADAKKLKAKSEKELSAKEKYEAGLKAKGDTNYEAAKEKFLSIEEGTAVHDNAQKELKEINSILAGKLKNQGEQAFNQNDYILAYEYFGKSIDLKCDEEVIDFLSRTEAKIKRDRRLKRQFKPHRIPAECK